MEEIKNEQTENTQSAEVIEQVTEETEGAVSLGKFKDAAALLKAYNSLQSEFTKRCQRLKELESAAANGNEPEIKISESNTQSITEKDKEEILKGYLKSVLDSKSKAIVMDGAGATAKTPSLRPKSLADAGEYAKKLFNDKQ